MYTIYFYSGSSRQRQESANKDGCDGYLDLQFNYSPNIDQTYSSTSIASNSTEKTKLWARKYTQMVVEDFNTTMGGYDGIFIGGLNGRCEDDLINTKMPAILAQPLFATNPLHANWIKNKSVQLRLARIIAKSIYKMFPDGGLFAFNASEYCDDDYKEVAHLFSDKQYVCYAENILRQASVMIHSQVASSISNYKTTIY